jgi:CPA1 family monovalent cation:H+ antiporter
MTTLYTLTGLLTCAILLTWVAHRVGVPFPIVLVLGGGLLGFVPGLPEIPFDPDLILVLMLPPVLFAAAYQTSLRDFKQQLRAISLLAIGLVIVTTLGVGAVLKWLLPDIPWAVAFTFGAIVSPPDAVAATSIFSRLRAPRALVTTVEGESLLNDASALVLYKFAVVAALTGAFSVRSASLEFIYVAAGGLLIGWVGGRALNWVSIRMRDPQLQVMFTLVMPYLVYLAAESAHTSWVLAVVASGLVGARCLSEAYSAEMRILAWSFWQVVTILLVCLVFILIGSQLHAIVQRMTPDQLPQMLLMSAALTAAAIAIRMLWVFPGAYLPRKFDEVVLKRRVRYPPWQHLVILGWCGMRGIVSLVAVLALPLTLADGTPFPFRDELIVLTFVVTLLTLVIPGLTLAPLMRALRIRGDADAPEELRLAREETARAAIHGIERFERDGVLTADIAEHLKRDYEARLHHTSAHRWLMSYDSDPYFKGKRAALAAERERLLALSRSQRISDDVLHEIEREIDFEEARLPRG